jgi:hypothetical protein
VTGRADDDGTKKAGAAAGFCPFSTDPEHEVLAMEAVHRLHEWFGSIKPALQGDI